MVIRAIKMFPDLIFEGEMKLSLHSNISMNIDCISHLARSMWSTPSIPEADQYNKVPLALL